jgi:hypothetical protein
MLTDPLPIAASYVTAADIPAISRDNGTSKYRITVSGVTYTVTISHTVSKGRRRSLVRLDVTNIVADPYVSTQYIDLITSIYLVIDRHEKYVSDANVLIYVKELLGVLDAAAFANVTTTRLAQIIGGES